MDKDPWLDRWLELIKQKSTNGLVLELGCGWGWDTLELLKAGCNVIASDLSIRNLRTTKITVPKADALQLDNGKSFPFVDHSIEVIIASLSLHYFPWTDTLQIASELKRCIKTDGILFARFNSTNDINYGAGYGLEIEPNFYQSGTHTKRFFNEESIQTMLHGWNIRFLEENIIHRYEKPKSVWEVLAQT